MNGNETRTAFESLHLTDIEKPQHMKKHVVVDAKLSVNRSASIVPHTFFLRCPAVDKEKPCPARAKAEENGKGDKFFCALEEFTKGNAASEFVHKIETENPVLLSAYQAKKETVDSIVYYNFPCSVEKFRHEAQVREPDYLSIRECLFYPDAKSVESSKSVTDAVDETGNPYRSQSLFYITDGPDLLEPASSLKLYGQVHPHPRTQKPTIIVSNVEKGDRDASQFKLTDDIKIQFERLGKIPLEDLATQLSHATQIYERPLTHILALLVFHSALEFQYEGKLIKGTLDVLLLGDSGVGKTQILKSLVREIKLGQFITGSCASRTGLCYAILQIDREFEIQWGAYASNDKGLLVVDEGQDVSADDWEKLSVGRSDGILTVDRVTKGEHPARTRMIVLANPKSGRLVDSELNPCMHLKRMFTTKDIRRFDLAQALTSSDVPENVALRNPKKQTASENIDMNVIRNSVLYAWSRRANNIHFKDGFTDELHRCAEILLAEYGAAKEIPLVGADIRDKLLKLAAAHAILRHNSDESGENIFVEALDVESITRIVSKIYSNTNFGLGSYATTQIEATKLRDDEFEAIKLELIGDSLTQAGTLIRRKLIKLFAETSELTGTELATSVDLDRKTISGNLSSFKKYGLVTAKRGSGYKATAKFNHFVRRLQSTGTNISQIDQEYFT